MYSTMSSAREDGSSRAQVRKIASETSQEIPTTQYWRDLMQQTRLKRGIKQTDLAKTVGIKQAQISAIETGVLLQSRWVPAISAALGIPLPVILIEDEWDERWCELGRILRRLRPAYFQVQLEAFEALAASAKKPS